MKRLKIFEEFTNDSLVTTILKNMIQRVKMSFNGENNIFSPEELQVISLVDIEKSTVNDAVEKNVLMNFQDTEYNINVMFVIQPYSKKDEVYTGSIKIDLIDLESTDFIIGNHYNIEIIEEDGGVKVKELTGKESQEAQTQGQPQGQPQGQETKSKAGFTVFENYIIEKVSELKEDIEKQKNIE